MQSLTPRQKQVFRVVVEYIAAHGFAPTVREIADAIGISSTNGVGDHIAALERKGWLERTPYKARGLKVTAGPVAFMLEVASRALALEPHGDLDLAADEARALALAFRHRSQDHEACVSVTARLLRELAEAVS